MTIHDASPNFVPHAKWDQYQWLMPLDMANQEPWYYAKPGAVKSKPKSDFYESVDAPLRYFVRWLHRNHCLTGPSCAGHEIRPDTFDRIYQRLSQHAKHIRAKGLDLVCVETQQPFRLCNPEYVLPWPSSQSFVAAATEHQRTGFLSFKAPPEMFDDNPFHHPRFDIEVIGNRYTIMTKDPHAWGLVFQYFAGKVR